MGIQWPSVALIHAIRGTAPVHEFRDGAQDILNGGLFILPNCGCSNNAGDFFSDCAARLQQVNFSFTLYIGSTGNGGSYIASRIAGLGDADRR